MRVLLGITSFNPPFAFREVLLLGYGTSISGSFAAPLSDLGEESFTQVDLLLYFTVAR